MAFVRFVQLLVLILVMEINDFCAHTPLMNSLKLPEYSFLVAEGS